MTIEDRFWSKVDKRGGPDACWPWTASRVKFGYGWFGIGKRHEHAHRLAWRLGNDGTEIPKGMCVLHGCDNPECCNPKHLRIGTKQDNSDDKLKRGRQPSGDMHWSRRMPWRRARGAWFSARMRETARKKFGGEDFMRVRALREKGLTQREIAKQAGMSQTHVGRILRGEGCYV